MFGNCNTELVLVVVLVIANDGDVITLKLTCPDNPGQNTIIEASGPLRQGVEANQNFRDIGTCPAPAQGSSDITPLYVARYCTPGVGAKVFVRVHQMQGGFTSVPTMFWGIVPDA